MKVSMRRWAVVVFAGAAVAGSAYWYAAKAPPGQSPGQTAGAGTGQSQRGGGGRGKDGAERPIPVLSARAAIADVPVYLEGVGTVKAWNTVTVQPQIDGKLLSVNYREGQDVKRGDVLAKIDPVIYEAQLNQALAKKAQDEAQLANARLDLERSTRIGSNYVTQKTIDTQRAQATQLEAQVKSDQAAVDNAKAYLGYTDIIAPIDGRTGIRQVDEGNIVRAAGTTGIVTITQVRPLSVVFNLPQQNLGQINKAFAAGALTVEAMAPDNKTVIDKGALQVVDNQVDQTTGTVKLKADFPNTDLQLWPGQFVNVRLLIETLKDVTIVPVAAVQRGPNGTFVFIVTEANTVTVRPVTVAQQDDARAVVSKGLQTTERVVTTGFTRLTEGSRVSATAEPAAAGAQSGAVPGSAPADGATPPLAAHDRPERGKRDGARGDSAKGDGAKGEGSRRGPRTGETTTAPPGATQ